jgi:hypothetical protein
MYVANTTQNTGAASLTITNTTFYQNVASYSGGGLAVENTNAGTGANTVALTSLTVDANHADGKGGGLWLITSPVPASYPAIRNSIIADDSANEGGMDVAGIVHSLGFNLIEIVDTDPAPGDPIPNWNYSVAGTGWVASDRYGLADSPLDPQLDGAGPTNNGGWTYTIRVATTSLAYRSGDPTLGGTADQRGYLRSFMLGGNPVTTRGAYDPDAVAP